MGKSSSAKQQVTDYHMSLHFGICIQADSIHEIVVQEKTAWLGESSGGILNINQPNLFGGPKKEGGLVGSIGVFMGGPTQTMPTPIAQRWGMTESTSPGYRGITSLFFAGTNYQGGFLWSSNNPIVANHLWVRVRRHPRELDSENAVIITPGGWQANPAHMIYSCMVDGENGWGLSPDLIGASFLASAVTLKAEGLGLSMALFDQMEVGEFIAEIVDHIQANFFFDPRSGKFELKLIRDDYDVGSLPVFDASNSHLETFSRKGWGETVNEISVVWTNPRTEKEETVTYHDLGNIAAQNGDRVHASRPYYGVRDADLAAKLCAREVRAASAPVASASLRVDRRGWTLTPGDCLILNYPEKRANNLVMRIGDVIWGKPEDPHITLALVEDIFSLERPAIAEVPTTQAPVVSTPPTPMDAAFVWTLPYYFVVNPDLQESAHVLNYPEVMAGVLGAEDVADVRSYELMAEAPTPAGGFAWSTFGTKTALPRFLSVVSLSAESETTIDAAHILLPSYRTVSSGDIVVIGNGGDQSSELSIIKEISGAGAITLSRGVLDTVPQAWPTGTPLWFISPTDRVSDERIVRAHGESPEYKFLTQTSLGILPLEDATVVTAALSDRPHCPLRPANVAINGQRFGAVSLSPGQNIAITWATRNRLFEDTIILPWTASTVTPEYKQRTIVTVTNPAAGDALIVRYEHLWTEQEFTLHRDWFARWSSVRVTISSEREGFGSIQSRSFVVSGLAGNPSAPPPPDPPDPGIAPAPIAPPSAGAFDIAGGAVTNEDGVSTPVITLSGTPDNQSARSLVVRYRRVGDTNWTTLSGVNINGT